MSIILTAFGPITDKSEGAALGFMEHFTTDFPFKNTKKCSKSSQILKGDQTKDQH